MKNLILLIAMILISEYAFSQETRKKIVVIDTGINEHQLEKPYLCKNGVVSTIGKVDATNQDLSPNQQHGTNVAGIIGSKIDTKKYCVYSIRAFDTKIQPTGYMEALHHASTLSNVVAVNLSMSGENYIMQEHAYLTKFILNKVMVVVAAGNEQTTLTREICKIWPACLKNYYDTLGLGKYFIVVTAPDVPSANKVKGFIIHIKNGFERGHPKLSGSSQAAAEFTGSEFSPVKESGDKNEGKNKKNH